MSLKVKMDGDSRLAKQFNFANTANTLATRLDNQERVHLVRRFVSNPNGRTDALGRVLELLDKKPAPGLSSRTNALASYLGVDASRLPKKVLEAVTTLEQANDYTEGVETRRVAVAGALRKLASAVKNARIGAARPLPF